jgi:hypothetical protein
MGFFSKLFGGDKTEPPVEEPVDEPPPDVVVVLRRGMSVPDGSYIAQVIAGAFPEGLPETVARVGLSQPGWFKSEEIADSIATDVAATFAVKHALGDDCTHRRRVLAGPEGAPVMVVELRRCRV